MKYCGKSRGGVEWAKPVVATKYWVYVHKNIVPVEAEAGAEGEPQMYEFDQWEYALEEYVQMLAEQSIDTQMALIELAGGG